MAEVPGWYVDFVAALIARLPRDLDEATAQRWTQDPDALEDALRAALLASPAPGPTRISAQLKHDKSAEGWKLLEDVTEPARVSRETIEAGPFPRVDEGLLLGDEMVALVQEIESKLGQRHAEYLLEHQEQIPEEFQRYSLVFPGTVWLGRDENHHVPCLVWTRRGEWELQFGILEAGVDSNDYLVRARA